MPHDAHTAYYLQQAGGGINTFYSASNRVQRGRGFLGGLFRAVIPLLSRGAKFLGRTALHSGAQFMEDVVNKRPVKEAFRTRLGEAGDAISERVQQKVSEMTGSGILSAKRRKRSQSSLKALPLHTALALARLKKRTKKRRATVGTDIFS